RAAFGSWRRGASMASARTFPTSPSRRSLPVNQIDGVRDVPELEMRGVTELVAVDLMGERAVAVHNEVGEIGAHAGGVVRFDAASGEGRGEVAGEVWGGQGRERHRHETSIERGRR